MLRAKDCSGSFTPRKYNRNHNVHLTLPDSSMQLVMTRVIISGPPSLPIIIPWSGS